MNTSTDPAEMENQDTNENARISLFFDRIISKWWLFGIGTCIGILVAFFLMRYTSPEYKISTKLLIEDEKKGGGSFNSADFLGDMSSLLDVKSNIDNEVEILKTREMAENVVKGLDLNISYYRSGTFKNTQIFPAPFKIIVISPADTIKASTFKLVFRNGDSISLSYSGNKKEELIQEYIAFDHPFIVKEIGVLKIEKNLDVSFLEKEYDFTIVSIDQATEKLQKDMSISAANKMVSIIDISLNHSLPKYGETILNKFIEGYMKMNLLDKNSIADSTILFIDNRIKLVSQELGDIEQNIQTFKQKNQLADLPEQSRILVSNANTNEKELTGLKTQESIIEALEEYLNDESKHKSAIPGSILLQDAAFNKLADNYNVFLLDRERQLLTSTENNPYIGNLDQRIGSIRKALLSNLTGTKKSVKIKLAELEKMQTELGSQMTKVPINERTYLGMFRQQSLKQELYLFLLQKREEVALSKTSNISSFKIIEHPKSANKPFKPNGLILIAVCILMGLAVPFAMIYVLELLNNRIQSKEDITCLVSIPVIGEIYKAKSNDLFVNSNPKSILSEQFRDLRSNLNFYFNAQQSISILLTSSMQAEGKTFTALNLGTILALTDKKVLIIDLDLRVARLTEQLGLKHKSGFTNYLISSDSDFHSHIHASSLNENLFIMPSGALPPNPAELLMKERTGELFQKLKEEFNYIIFDSPPIGLVSDAQILSKNASITLFLVRENYTYKRQINHLRELHKAGKLGNTGIILNDIKINSYSKYGYGQYGYGLIPEDRFFKKMTKKIFGV